ncbi:MAG TPA: hypothetical protein VHX61_03015 [Rhizomicrobium sp.]|nr:hypothetical protein [Rhizomicrobium sp.]
MIAVRNIGQGDPLRFEVTVSQSGSATRHEVTMSCAVFNTLGGGAQTPECCIEAAFRFLLDREPKEAILRKFDVTVIEGYFPEFSREFPRYLASR